MSLYGKSPLCYQCSCMSVESYDVEHPCSSQRWLFRVAGRESRNNDVSTEKADSGFYVGQAVDLPFSTVNFVITNFVEIKAPERLSRTSMRPLQPDGEHR